MIHEIFSGLWLSFTLGLAAPLVAVCVLPLYPAFLAYLSNKIGGVKQNKKIILLGLIATSGVIISLSLIGLIFTTLLQESLTNAIGIISPIAFTILGIVSLLLIFNVNVGNLFPKFHAPVSKNPYISSLIFGLFFGLIVLPCNPGALIAVFALSTSTLSAISNFFQFVAFGFGMGTPLLVLAVISGSKSTKVIDFLTKYTKKINLVVGIFMLVVSIYYLACVFNVFGLDFGFCQYINLPTGNFGQ